MGDSWHWIRSGAGDAPGNMAWDEALLEAAGDLGMPVLRSYGWESPAATSAPCRTMRPSARVAIA